MIISRTPFRLSFLGGGTDYPAWFRAHGGAVLAATIDKYCYLTCRYLPPFFEHRFRVVYSRVELTQEAREIAHPAVRAALLSHGIERGLEIHHDGDLPARSGMGSSSAFSVGLLHALHALEGSIPTPRRLAAEAIDLEQRRLGETVGCQDQVMAAHGGLNQVLFQPVGDYSIRPITLCPNRMGELNDSLMLFYTGIQRTASDIASTYVEGIESRARQLCFLQSLVEEGMRVLNSSGSLNEFGRLLHEAWMAKRSLSSAVTNSQVDELYEAATSAGAVGGKLTGAGGGGFLLLFVPPERQRRVRERLRRLIHVPFRFEFEGSRIIYFDPEPDYAVVEHLPRRHAAAPPVFAADLVACAA